MSKYGKKTFYTFENLKNNLSKPIYLNESCLLNDLTKYMPLPPITITMISLKTNHFYGFIWNWDNIFNTSGAFERKRNGRPYVGMSAII